MINYLINLIFRLPENPLKKAIRNLYYSDFVSERLIEYPFVFKNLQLDKGRILDVGCYYSILPIQLASLGFKVYAIDPQPYQLEHPNFVFVKGDIQKNNFKKNFFDVVTVVSTLEHIGLGYYLDKEGTSGDKLAIREIGRILKKSGKLIMTIPYGKKFRITKSQRMYDNKSLKNLLFPEFRLREKMIFVSKKGKWMPGVEDKLANVRGERTMAVAMVVAEKK